MEQELHVERSLGGQNGRGRYDVLHPHEAQNASKSDKLRILVANCTSQRLVPVVGLGGGSDSLVSLSDFPQGLKYLQQCHPQGPDRRRRPPRAHAPTRRSWVSFFFDYHVLFCSIWVIFPFARHSSYTDDAQKRKSVRQLSLVQACARTQSKAGARMPTLVATGTAVD